jgi:hypothetical protein
MPPPNWRAIIDHVESTPAEPPREQIGLAL